MKDTLGLIPQVFYDVIARIAPGAATLALLIVVMATSTDIHTVASTFRQLSVVGTGVTFLGGLVAAYVFGFLLGAIGSVIEDGLKQPAFADIRKTAPGADIEEEDIPYIYDFILFEDPAAGGRLAKLRAEGHMCRGLVVGFVVVAIVHIATSLRPGGTMRAAILIGLLVSALAVFNFQRHLRTRAWRLQVNAWLMLRPETRKSTAATGEVTSKSPTHLDIKAKPTETDVLPTSQS